MTIDYRSEFDLPRDLCYLNAAYMTPQPKRVAEATMQGAQLRAQPWRITPEDFFTGIESLRSAFARQVGCAADNIAIVPSAGYGVACAAKNLATQRGDLILVLEDQFPSNYYAWRRQALESEAKFLVVHRDPQQLWADALKKTIRKYGDRIKIAALEGHHWASAEHIDLETVIPALREGGIRIVLDLTQTIGGCPVDIAALAPDFMVAAAYKWQFSPYGVSFLYVDDQYFDGVPIEEAWMDRDGAEDFSRLAEFTDSYQPGARRYDMSAKSSFSNIAGASAAQSLLAEWGIETISQTLDQTNDRIANILEQHGFDVMPRNRRGPHFQAAHLPATDPRELAARLIENNVYASVRGEFLRVAPHLYTDDEDLARFDRALEMALK